MNQGEAFDVVCLILGLLFGYGIGQTLKTRTGQLRLILRKGYVVLDTDLTECSLTGEDAVDFGRKMVELGERAVESMDESDGGGMSASGGAA